jgi:hypothetical protein
LGFSDVDPRASKLLPFSPGIAQAGLDPFNDQAALEFCDRAQDRENHLSCWGTGVDVLRKGYKIDSQGLDKGIY